MTTTSTAPVFVAEGVVTVICVELLKVSEAADFEFTESPKTLFDGSSTKATVAPLTKFVPVMTVDVPPPRTPEVTERLVIVGAAAPIAKTHDVAAETAPLTYRESESG